MKDDISDEGLSLKNLTYFFRSLFNGSENNIFRQFYERNVNHEESTTLKNDANGGTSINETCSGWRRIKAIYQDSEVHGEKEATTFISKAAFLMGAFVGGFFNVGRTIERYNMYSEGKKFISRNDIVLRKWDYAIVVFMKNGLKAGIKSAAVAGSIALLSSHLAAWRNHFSAWYFPLISVPIFAILSLPYGSCALIEGTTIGLSTGLTLTAGTYLIAYANQSSVNEAYNTLKFKYEEKIRKEKKRRSQIYAIMKEKNLWFPGDAARILNEQELSESSSLEDQSFMDDTNPSNIENETDI